MPCKAVDVPDVCGACVSRLFVSGVLQLHSDNPRLRVAVLKQKSIPAKEPSKPAKLPTKAGIKDDDEDDSGLTEPYDPDGGDQEDDDEDYDNPD